MSIETIATTIKSLRRSKKLTQGQLAESVGMSRATISGIENNTVTEIGVRKIEMLLNALGHTLTTKPVGRPTLDEVTKQGFHDAH